MGTPNPYDYGGGQSVISSVRSPGHGPGFSPYPTLGERNMFSPGGNYLEGGMSPAILRSPNPYIMAGQSPGPATPSYTLHGINRMQSPSLGSAYQRDGEGRYSGFRNLGSSSSPSYSERILSQSPNYSPASSRHSSPNYSPRGDSNRQ